MNETKDIDSLDDRAKRGPKKEIKWKRTRYIEPRFINSLIVASIYVVFLAGLYFISQYREIPYKTYYHAPEVPIKGNLRPAPLEGIYPRSPHECIVELINEDDKSNTISIDLARDIFGFRFDNRKLVVNTQQYGEIRINGFGTSGLVATRVKCDKFIEHKGEVWHEKDRKINQLRR